MQKRKRAIRHPRKARVAAVPMLLLGLGLIISGPTAAQDRPEEERGFDPGQVFQFTDFDDVNLFNGSLSVRIPLGGSYPVGGGLSYSFTLVYTSKVWDFEGEGHRATPAHRDNAGLGWLFTLGRLIPPGDPANPTKLWGPSSRWQYLSPDGSMHGFGNTSGVSYTNDGSHLRMKECPDPTAEIPSTLCTAGERAVEFPDGTIHVFLSDGRLRRIEDRFGNYISVTYPDSTTWEVRDATGRLHRFSFQNVALNGSVRQVLASAELAAFGATTAPYSFHYANPVPSIRPPCADPFYEDAPPIEVALLERIDLPDGSSYGARYSYTTALGSCSFGLLDQLTLPTGGQVEYGYRPWHFPVLQCASSSPPADWAQASDGIHTRELKDGTVSLGTWTYSQVLEPGPADMPSNPCAGPDERLPAEISRVTVLQPDQHQTVHYFSVWPFPNNQGVSPNGSLTAEYGLPVHRGQADATEQRYLSTETFDCSGATCEAIRRTYLRYEWEFGCDPGQLWACRRDGRLVSRRTEFVDDSNNFVDVDFSDFDGLGHYRETVVSGNFSSSPQQFSRTNFNPGRGTYVVGGGTDHTFVLPGEGEPWVLNTYDEVRLEKNNVGATEHFCFDLDTGGLLGHRRLKADTGEGANDLLTLTELDTGGNVTLERHYGGDTSDAPEAVFSHDAVGDCTISEPLSLPAYRLEHTYQAGALATSKFVDPGNGSTVLETLDLDIDGNTGLPSESREANNVWTTFDYDSLGRLIKTQRQDLAPTFYVFAPTGTPPHVIVHRDHLTDNTTLTKGRFEFDGLGRPIREQRRVPAPGATTEVTDVEIEYDQMGRTKRRSVAVAVPNFGKPAAEKMPANWTSFDYDALGRVTKVTAPDSSETTFSYIGARVVDRTVKIDGVDSTTREVYDVHGRLKRVVEESGTGGANIPTDYAYDFADRLISVSMNSGVQKRSFGYDRLGFLRSEGHPELGVREQLADKPQRRALLSQYDALGNAGRREVEDGPVLASVYDLAGRVTQVRDGGGRLLKELFYADTRPAVGNVGTDLRAGKLVQAKRHNYITDPADGAATDVVITETLRYGGKAGALSEIGLRSSRGPHFDPAYLYNQLGEVAQVHYPSCTRPPCATPVDSGRRIDYGFPQGVLNRITDAASNVRLGRLFYHPSGMLRELEHSNGTTDTITQDGNGMTRPLLLEVKKGTQSLWSSGNFSYDGAGNVTAIGSDTFDYDGVGRLISGSVLSSTQTATYDPYGNLESLVTGGTSANIAVSPATNRLTMAGVTYDNSGNVTSLGSLSEAVYDPFNRIKELRGTGVNRAFLYDVSDRRVAILDGQDRTTTWSVRSIGDKVLGEMKFDWDAETVTLEREYVYRGTSLLAAFDAAVRHYHLDHLGSPRLVTQATGAVVAEYNYYPFGELHSSIGDDHLLFTGHERDFNCEGGCSVPEQDDLDYMLARYYTPRLARFLSIDPAVGNPTRPQGWNRFSYASNNPITLFDPDGREDRVFVIAIGVNASMGKTKGSSSSRNDRLGLRGTSTVGFGFDTRGNVGLVIESKLSLRGTLLDFIKPSIPQVISFGDGKVTLRSQAAAGSISARPGTLRGLAHGEKMSAKANAFGAVVDLTDSSGHSFVGVSNDGRLKFNFSVSQTLVIDAFTGGEAIEGVALRTFVEHVGPLVGSMTSEELRDPEMAELVTMYEEALLRLEYLDRTEPSDRK